MNSQQVGSLSLQLHLQPSPRSRARLNKGEERRDIRQYGQCLQTGTSTVKRPESEVVSYSISLEDAPIFQPRRFAASTCRNTPQMRESGKDNLMTDQVRLGWEQPKYSVFFSVKPCSQTSAGTSVVLGQREAASSKRATGKRTLR